MKQLSMFNGQYSMKRQWAMGNVATLNNITHSALNNIHSLSIDHSLTIEHCPLNISTSEGVI